jgi:AcrR family transcriptional regulator
MTTVRKEKPRRERKKEEVRARIIETAIGLFARHGLANVTVDHIADMADIGKGTIYNYFETKEDIVVAYMAELENKIQAKVQAMNPYKGKNLAEILTNFVRYQFQLKKKHHEFVRVFLGQMFLRTAQFMPYMVEMQKAIDPPLELLFQELQNAGKLRKDIDLMQLILVFKTIQLGLTGLWAIEGPPFRGTEMVLEQEIKMFCEGLEARRK